MAEPKPKNNKKYRRVVIFLWVVVLGGIIGAAGIVCLTALEALGDLPDPEELENPKTNLASEIYTADQELIGKYFRENRTNIEYSELSPHLVNALVSTEDERFYGHSGVDFRGLVRAIVYMGSKGGASTITQQLAKNLFPREQLSKIGLVLRKIKEWVIASELERRYTKEEIIAMYFNKFDFINNAVGIKSAAHVYFNTTPDSLTIEQSAMLVGMCQNPALFNPLRRPDTTKHRRNIVFAQMLKNQKITREEFDSLKLLPIELDYRIVDHKEGIAPYFREVLRSDLTKMFNEKNEDGAYILQKPDGKPYNIYSDGLKIYTTIDSRMQRYAEWAVHEHLSKELQKDFWKDLKRRSERNKHKVPFDWRVSEKEIEAIMETARKRTDTYKIMTGRLCPKFGVGGNSIKEVKEDGQVYFESTWSDYTHRWLKPSEDSIKNYFDKPKQMYVFSYDGMVDTTMSPNDSIKYYKSYLQAGLMSVDPHTGYIKAWVGGIDFKSFAYDHVKQARRQVGSTFKPIVYSLAIQEGYSPCYEIPNIPYTLEKGKWGLQRDWTPKNTGYVFNGMVSLKFGLANSMNNVTAWVTKQYGPHAVLDFARKIGITSPMEPVPSLCLGVADLTLYEMVGANATFVNKGVWQEPIYISRIEDKNGNVIKDFRPKIKEAMSEETAYVMLNLMKGVVDGVYNENITKGPKAPGTAMRIRASTKSKPYAGFRTPIAGKTGTTQNHSDGWFMGLTPDLVTGIWVGAEDRSVRFSRLSLGMGTNMALPVWGYYMQKVYADKTLDYSDGDFEKPEKELEIELDCKAYRQSQNNNNFGQDPNFDR